MAKRKHPPCQMMIVEEDGQPVIYIEFDGKRIAERAHPDSPQARSRVSLEPGFQVLDGERHPDGACEIIVTRNGVTIQ